VQRDFDALCSAHRDDIWRYLRRRAASEPEDEPGNRLARNRPFDLGHSEVAWPRSSSSPGAAGTSCRTRRLGALLTSALTPVPVKVALFEVLERLPGATLVDRVTDPEGRTGIGVRFQDEAWDTLFLFDPANGHLLGTRSVGHKEVEGRDIADWSLVLDSKRTDDAPAR
jgi:hypothetical protein